MEPSGTNVRKLERCNSHNQRCLSKWGVYLGILGKSVGRLADDTVYFQSIKMISLKNGSCHVERFEEWISYQYAQSACMCIRRLCKGGRKVVSLYRLIQLIQSNRHIVVRDIFSTDAVFELYAHGGLMVSEDYLQSLYEKLRATTSLVAYVDKKIAHHELESADTPTYNSIFNAVNIIIEVYSSLYGLLNRGNSVSFTRNEPNIQALFQELHKGSFIGRF